MGSLTVCNPTVSGRVGASAIGKTYYISPTGNDNNDGLTQGSAWQTIAKVNSGTYYPGDKILFQGGQVFSSSVGILLNTTTCPAGGGTAANAIELGSYGTGKASLFITSVTQDGIKIANLSYVTIKNLTLIGSSTGTYGFYSGILFVNSASVYQYGCNVYNCEISYFPCAGIFWGGNTTIAPGAGYSNSAIVGCQISACVLGGIQSAVYGNYGDATNTVHNNLYVGYCHVFRCVGDPVFNAQPTGSGIAFFNTRDTIVEYCIAANCGGGNESPGGPVGIWCGVGTNITFQYCEVYGQLSTVHNKYDGTGFDLDQNSTGCIIQYCYAHDCEGEGILTYAAKTGNIIRFNTLINNGTYGGKSQIRLDAGVAATTQYVYCNTLLGQYSGAFVNSTTSIWQNNLIIVQANGTLVNNAGGGTFQNNAYWELTNPTAIFKVLNGGTTYNSLADWQAIGQEKISSTPVGFFGDPLLTTPYSSSTVAPKYTPYGVANKKLTGFAPVSATAPNGVGAIDIPSQSMGGKDFSGTAFTQPYSGKTVGAISVPTTPKLVLTGSSIATTGTPNTYTIAIQNPVAGATFTPTATGSGVVTPTTVTPNSGNSYSATFTVQWAGVGNFSVGGSAAGFTDPTAISVSVGTGAGSNDPTTVQNAIASQLPNVPSAKRSVVATAMIASVSGQSYYATDIVNALAAPATIHWTSADMAKCYALSTDSTPNISSLGSSVGKMDAYVGAQSWTQSASGNRPTITASGLLFASPQSMVANYAFSTPVGLYVIAQRAGSSNQYADIIGGDGNQNFSFITDATNTVMYATTSTTNGTGLTVPITNMSQMSLIGAVFNDPSSIGYNGTTQTVTNTAAGVATTTVQHLAVRGNGNATTYFNGYVQDMIVNTDPTKALMLLRFLKAYRGL